MSEDMPFLSQDAILPLTPDLTIYFLDPARGPVALTRNSARLIGKRWCQGKRARRAALRRLDAWRVDFISPRQVPGLRPLLATRWNAYQQAKNWA